MLKSVNSFLAGILMLGVILAPQVSQAQAATVKVSLLDMTSVGGPMMGRGGQGYGHGMMGRGMGGPGMMGPDNYGMRGRGGYGPGFGMMGHGMMFIRTDRDSVKAGKIQFDVVNLSLSEPHEMAVVKVSNIDAALPYDYNTWKVIEKQIKLLGETHSMKPKETKRLELTLEPGAYLLICNLPGHYAAGMVIPFNVTP